ncbi:MAG: glucose 1-dehydrogenase [Acidimicrobiia bacterium]|nr:glucose 1-dehydrogenase [Acidimicrobiia bacterium]MDH5520271.1 glucose 1-dehydrogenase [Acidimicrobiia bacterium]
MTNPFDLTGRVALVTGSSRGIGLALARALGGAGAQVVLNARSAEALDDAAATLRDEGLTVDVRAADVTDAGAVTEMIESIETAIGPLDVLVNNAGMQDRAPVLEFPVDRFRALLELNLVAPFVVAQAAARPMAARGRGKIINIGSVQSELGRPTIVPYTASKGGLNLMTRGLCADLGPKGIQINTLAPGYFATELTQALVNDEEFSAWVAARTPAGRWGRVEELGGAVVFLASDASSFVNGQTLFVDGGMTAVV